MGVLPLPKGPAGLIVQGKAFAFRCSRCDAPGAGSLTEFAKRRRHRGFIQSEQPLHLSW
jgi:hypothetical protein